MKRGVDYIGVGVGAIIVDSRGRLFMARRSAGAGNERGRWEFPGGAVEFGETLEQALKREMREEFGVEIEVSGLLDVVDHLLPDEGQHWVSPTFLCRIAAGEPSILEPEKCDRIDWFYPADVPRDLSGASSASLAHYRELLRVGSAGQ